MFFLIQLLQILVWLWLLKRKELIFQYSTFSNKPNWGIAAIILSCSADICTGGGSLKNESKAIILKKYSEQRINVRP